MDLAVACEAFLRDRVMAQLPPELPSSFTRHLDEVNIRRVIDYSISDILNENEQKTFTKIRSTINKLLDARNKIAHIGRKDDVTIDQCLEFLRAAHILIEGELPPEGQALEEDEEDE